MLSRIVDTFDINFYPLEKQSFYKKQKLGGDILEGDIYTQKLPMSSTIKQGKQYIGRYSEKRQLLFIPSVIRGRWRRCVYKVPKDLMMKSLGMRHFRVVAGCRVWSNKE